MLAALALSPTPATAQTLVTSAKPDSVSVTVYRDPDRDADTAMDRDFLNGYALITETRTITLPAGRAVIRFEGVSGGIMAESAIVAGLPTGVTEKNLDADLLSPRALFDRALGRRVTIRRTSRATGKVITEQAVIRSSADGAAVIETSAGIEAVQCGGLSEAILYDGVPKGLSAKPTLSIEVDGGQAATVTITLSYLAGGFDWQANYVVTMRQGTAKADLFAWVTLASTDITSYPQAGTQLVAGKIERDGDTDPLALPDGDLRIRCWPTSGPPPMPMMMPPPPPPAPMAVMAMSREDLGDIIVTAARRVEQEELGDLKLYRVPQPVTVAARAQKQVALLDKTGVTLDAVYVSFINEDGVTATTRLELRTRNRKDSGLGEALPAGSVAVFDASASRPILIGETSLDDKAVGEKIALSLDTAPGVSVVIVDGDTGRDWDDEVLTVTNRNPWPVAYEARIRVDPDDKRIRAKGGAVLVRGEEDERLVWRVTVPANGNAVLSYRLIDTN